jgi:hypothetical protein
MKKANLLSEIHNKFPPAFINQLMSEIKLKQYNFRSSDPELRRKKTFKENFTQHYKQKVKDQEHKNKGNLHHHHGKLVESMPEQEKAYVEEFLDQFILDANQEKGFILDIKLALKALPGQIDRLNEF